MKFVWLIGSCFLLPVAAFAQSPTIRQAVPDYIKLGKAELAKRNANSAIAWFTEATRRYPDDAEAYHLRGKVYLELKGAVADAIADFSRAIRLNPALFDAYLDRARAYQVKGDLDRAIADCNHVLWHTSTSFDGFILRGQLRLLKAQYDQAIADCSEAIRLNPKDVRPYRLRAEAYSALKKAEEAAGDLRKAQELSR